MLKTIDTSVFTFEDSRKRNCLYVDKTEYIWQLINGSAIYFLSRPRRFGKSLLLSTLKAYFSGKKELFKGLKIEQLAPDEWEKYPIIHLDMASTCAQTVEEFEHNLRNIIQNCATQTGVQLKDDYARIQLKELILSLYNKWNKQVVILIDEYDKPILDVLGKPTAHDFLDHIGNFYQEIKSANAQERFVFITGVTKFAYTSIFSGLNNPTDITMSAQYATMLGYTREELETYFAEYIDVTAKALNMTRDALLTQMDEWYDGFQFHVNVKTVFNPVSVGKFFINKEFCNYWYDTGTPKFLVDVAKKKAFDIESFLNTPLPVYYFDKYDIDQVSPFIFAVQTGYITIKSSVIQGGQTLYIMDYPNKEVRDCFKEFLMGVYTKLTPEETFFFTKNLSESIDTDNISNFIEEIQPIFAGLVYENIMTKTSSVRYYEGYYLNVLATIFYVLNKDVESEVRTSDGRIDLVLKGKEATFIFELKVKGEKDDATKLLETALDQAIHQKHYAEKYRHLSQNIKVVAIVFDTQTRQVAA